LLSSQRLVPKLKMDFFSINSKPVGINQAYH
jgi:hypothetical protein